MRPRSSSQNPATIRNNVVLPHPEGPSNVKNSPFRMAIDTLSTAGMLPKLRATSSIIIEVTPNAPTVVWSACIAYDLLDFFQCFGSFRRPVFFVIFDDFYVAERRHLAWQLRQIKILARGAPEELAHD